MAVPAPPPPYQGQPEPDVKPFAASYLTTRARLWDTLKAELEAEARGKNLNFTPGNLPPAGFVETEESRLAEDFLERMRRMEDRA